MGQLLKCISIICLIWCVSGSLAWGEQNTGKVYLVVGSFRNLDIADREAKRITDETGIETRFLQSVVMGVDYYRLLVAQPGDPDEQTRLALQLDSAGVHDSWSIRVDDSQTYGIDTETGPGETAAPAAATVAPPVQVLEGEPIWLVIASFTDYAAAQDLVEQVLGSLGFIPELRDFVVENRSVIRVMAGPYLNSQQLTEAREQLTAAGYADVWSLQDDQLGMEIGMGMGMGMGMDLTDYPETTMESQLANIPRSQAASAELQQKRIQLVRQTRDAARQPENTIRPGFNLATLRKRDE